MSHWSLPFALLVAMLGCGHPDAHGASDVHSREAVVAPATITVCATPAGGVVVSFDSVAGFSTHEPLVLLRQRCRVGDTAVYDAVGWQAAGWAFPFVGARVLAVQ